MRSQSQGGGARNRIIIKLRGKPGSPSGVLRAGNIYFREREEGIEPPRFQPNVREPYGSIFLWSDHFPFVLEQLGKPDCRMVLTRFSDGGLRAELVSRSG